MPLTLPALPTWLWRGLAAAAAVIALIWGGSCYGRSRYNEGRKDAELAHTDSVRIALTRSIDSVHKSMEPVLAGLQAENDRLRAEVRQSRIQAANAIGRAQRAEDAITHLPDSLLKVTPPEVRALIDSVVAANHDLRVSVQDLAEKTVRLQAGKDSALAEAGKWKTLQEETRVALDTASREIKQLQKMKDPPRCGFKCGFVAGLLTVGAVVTTIVLVGR